MHNHGPLGHAWSGWGSYHHGCLKYGACFRGLDAQDDPVLILRLKDEDLLEAPHDSPFLQSLRFSCSRVNGVYPPLAMVEAFITDDDSTPRVRRLHLIVVDLNRRRRLATRVSRQLSKIKVDECATQCWNTLPIPWKQDQETYQLRYVFGYAMDGTDLLCYILWPFFDAFCFNPQRPWRTAASQALGIPSCHIAEDIHIKQLEENKFTLTPRRIPAERRATAEKSGADVVMDAGEESGSGAESGWSGVSDNSSTDSECTILEASSVASDQDRFDTAYEAFRDLSAGLYDIDTRQYARGVTSDDAPGVKLIDGQAKLRELVHLPKDIQTATHLTWILAEYMADTIAWLMRSILDHASKILFDNDTEPLLTPGFWILPLYRELLKRARGCTGLVKLICKENKEERGKRKFHEGVPHPDDRGGFTQWFGSCSLINTLYVWFPASWAPMVAERLFGLSWESAYPQHGQPASGLSQKPSGVHPWHQSRQEAAGSSGAMSDVDSTEVVYKIRQWSLPGAAVVPVLNVSSRVFWLELDDKALLDSYTVLQEGILCDVFSQKCSAAWQGAPGQRLTVAIMLPGRQDADDWLNFMLSQKNLWPTFTTRGTLTEEISEKTFRKERRRLQAKHLWMEVKLSWHVLANRMYTAAPTGKSREQLYALLFNKAVRGSQTNPYEEKAYRGPAHKAVQAWWEHCQEWMLYYKGQSAPLVQDLQGLLD